MVERRTFRLLTVALGGVVALAACQPATPTPTPTPAATDLYAALEAG